MTTLDTFNAFFDDAMNQKMSIHAFGMYAKGLIMNLEAEYQQLKEESETTSGDLTALINRAFIIMNDNKFFECNEEGEWYSSLHTAMTKVVANRKFTDRYTMQNIVIKGLKNQMKVMQAATICTSVIPAVSVHKLLMELQPSTETSEVRDVSKTCKTCSHFFENTINTPCPWSKKRDGYCHQHEPKDSK